MSDIKSFHLGGASLSDINTVRSFDGRGLVEQIGHAGTFKFHVTDPTVLEQLPASCLVRVERGRVERKSLDTLYRDVVDESKLPPLLAALIEDIPEKKKGGRKPGRTCFICKEYVKIQDGMPDGDGHLVHVACATPEENPLYNCKICKKYVPIVDRVVDSWDPDHVRHSRREDCLKEG